MTGPDPRDETAATVTTDCERCDQLAGEAS